MTKRFDELDFLKGIMIMLMVAFHLVYIGDGYPYVKQIVYTFHIPVFFIISGYLMNVEKPFLGYVRSLLWLLVPYLIMESGYILMASVLPIREHIDGLTPVVFVNKLFLTPIGPYWYLHSLILCSVVYYICFIKSRYKDILVARMVLSSAVLGFISLYWGIISLSSIFYFLVGVTVRQSSVNFFSFFRKSWIAILGFVVLIQFPTNLDRFTIGGVLVVYLVISSLLAIYAVLPHFICSVINYIGRHTLVILLFSPLFTVVVKPLVDVFAFDQTRLLFLFTALCINVCGCFLIGVIMDYCGITPYFFGKNKIMESIK